MRTTKYVSISALLAMIWLVTATPVVAQIDRGISYQGLLTQGNKQPLQDGRYEIVFRLFDNATNGNLLWEETQQVDVQLGLFNVTLGSVVTLATVDFRNTQVYLETSFSGQPPFPRTKLSVVPYAIRAETADSATAVNTEQLNVVRSINALRGNLVLEGGRGVVVTASGDTLRLSSDLSVDAIKQLSSQENTLLIGNPIGPQTTIDVRDGSITTSKLAPGSVTSSILSDGAVGTQQLGSRVVTADKIASGVVPTTLPPSGPAGGDLTGTYPMPVIAIDAVTTPKIRDASITTSKLADVSVTAEKLAPSGVRPGIYGDSATFPQLTIDSKGRVTNVSTFSLFTTAGGDLIGSYPNPMIRTGAVSTTKILDASVTNLKIADGAVTNAKLADNAVTGQKILDGTVTVMDLSPGTIPTSLPPSGPASGDLSGTYPSPSIATTSAAGSRIVDALRANYLSGDPDVNTQNNVVILDAQRRLPVADGSLITNLNASSITTGVLAVQFGGTNSSTALNNNRVMVSNGGRIVEAPQQAAGQLMIGSGSTTAPSIGSVQGGNGITVAYSAPNIVVSSTTLPGTTNDQTLRWDAAIGLWTPNSNVLATSSGNVTVGGSQSVANTLTVGGGLSVADNASFAKNGTVDGTLNVKGNTTLGDNASDVAVINASSVLTPNLPVSSATSGVVRRTASGQLEVSAATYTTSATPLAGNTALRTNSVGQIENVILKNSEVQVGITGAPPEARLLDINDLANAAVDVVGSSITLGWKPPVGVMGGSTALGIGALRNADQSDQNTAVGTNALSSLKSGASNTALGADAGRSLYLGDRNTFIGHYAGGSIFAGIENIGIGAFAFGGATMQGADGNIAIGSSVMEGMKRGTGNIALGGYAMKGIDGGFNIAVGALTMYSSQGRDNIALGTNTLMRITGNNNIALGVRALAQDENLLVGRLINGNIAIGYEAGRRLAEGGGNIFIGNRAGGTTSADMSNQLYIDNTDTDKPLIKGDFAERKLEFNGSAKHGGGVTYPVRIITNESYTVQDDDYAVVTDYPPIFPCYINLPDPTTCPGRMIVVRSRQGGNSQWHPYLIGTRIQAGPVEYALNEPRSTMTFQSDGSEWMVISSSQSTSYPIRHVYYGVDLLQPTDYTIVLHNSQVDLPDPGANKGKVYVIVFDRTIPKYDIYRYFPYNYPVVANGIRYVDDEISSVTIQSDGDSWIVISW